METTKCKKCEGEHRIEDYRTVKYYVCPAVNRVLLVNDGDDNERENETNTGAENSKGFGNLSWSD